MQSQPSAASGGIERHGIESIPDTDRSATIFDFVRIEWGGSISLATAVLGAFSVWSSGDAVVGAVQRFLHVHPTDFGFAAAYSGFAATALFMLGGYAFYPAFDAHFAGAGLRWGESRRTRGAVGRRLVAEFRLRLYRCENYRGLLSHRIPGLSQQREYAAPISPMCSESPPRGIGLDYKFE